MTTPKDASTDSQTRHGPDVFLSYASEDRARAAALVAALELHGFSVWWDAEIRANEEFSPVIEEHLDASGSVIVLWSTHSVNKSFVREEAVRGQSKLIPALLDDVQIPLGFGQASHVDLRRWRGDVLALALEPLMDNVARVTHRALANPKPSPWLVTRSVFFDLKTRIALLGVIVMFAIAWFTWGQFSWRVRDLQWALALLFAVCLELLFLRASRFARSAAWRYAALGLLVGTSMVWSMGVWVDYSLPTFDPGASGILVARFDPDSRDDRAQGTWANELLASKESGSTEGAEVLRPVTVQRMRQTIDSTQQAQKMASRAGALIVMWRDGEIRLTFADLPGFAKQNQQLPRLASGGTLVLGPDQRPTVALSESIIRFAAAYRAFSTSDFHAARKLLNEVVGLISIESGKKGTAPSSAGSMLATTHLLLGNTYFLDGCAAAPPAGCIDALDHYQSALDIFVSDDRMGNLFVEASNNWAVATWRLLHTWHSSIDMLGDAAFACAGKTLVSDPPLACTFVAYNQALAAIESGRYERALDFLEPACSGKTLTERGVDSGSAFPAECAQQQAYAAAKLGETLTTTAQADQWFRRAARFNDEARLRAGTAGSNRAAFMIAITEARIAVGRSDYRKAIELLGPSMQDRESQAPTLAARLSNEFPVLDGPEIAMLYALARICSRQVEKDLILVSSQLSSEARSYFERKVSACLES